MAFMDRFGIPGALHSGGGRGTQAAGFKQCFKMQSLLPSERGTEIPLGGVDWVEVWADWPVEVYINREPAPYLVVNRARFTGKLDQIWVRRLTATTLPAVVRITAGQSGMEFTNFDRDPQWLPLLPITVSIAYGAGVLVGQTSTFVVPQAANGSSEAHFVRGWALTRDAGNILEATLFHDMAADLAAFRVLQTAATFMSFEANMAIKMVSDWYLHVRVDSQAGATTVSGFIFYSPI